MMDDSGTCEPPTVTMVWPPTVWTAVAVPWRVVDGVMVAPVLSWALMVRV